MKKLCSKRRPNVGRLMESLMNFEEGEKVIRLLAKRRQLDSNAQLDGNRLHPTTLQILPTFGLFTRVIHSHKAMVKLNKNVGNLCKCLNMQKVKEKMRRAVGCNINIWGHCKTDDIEIPDASGGGGQHYL